MLHALKRILGNGLDPAFMTGLLMLAGLLLLLTRRWRRTGTGLLWAGMIVLVVASLPGPARWLASPLETAPPAGRATVIDPDWIVVLGAGDLFPTDLELPALSRLTDRGRARTSEAVRLAREFPDAVVLFCGGQATGSTPPEGDTMAIAAVELGLSPERAVSLPAGRDTEEQAAAVRAAVGDGRVLVVTSAVHMPRAMLWIWSAGVKATPAPCDFISRDPWPSPAWTWTPRSERVRQTA
jgi:uncharacterized SAM-binding protein YcdF (DUF218 family)